MPSWVRYLTCWRVAGEFLGDMGEFGKLSGECVGQVGREVGRVRRVWQAVERVLGQLSLTFSSLGFIERTYSPACIEIVNGQPSRSAVQIAVQYQFTI